MKSEGMGKRLKLRISRVFQSCRPSPAPPAFGLSPINPKARDIDFPPPLPTLFPRRLAPIVAAPSGCLCAPRRSLRRNPSTDTNDFSRARETPIHLWRRDLSVAAGDDDINVFILPTTVKTTKKKEKKKKKKSKMSQISFSSDSAWFSTEEDNDEEYEYNPYDDGDETETLLSSFEMDSSDSVLLRSGVLRPRETVCWPTPETRSPEGAAEAIRRMEPGAGDGKVRESFAVVKRSEDPKEDFRGSMAEMVLEKKIYDVGGLEQLLHCFLSLNSEHHHPAIVAAFSDIWDAIFPAATTFPQAYYN